MKGTDMRTLVFLAALVMCVWSCGKNELGTEHELLTAQTWRVAVFTVNPAWIHPQDGREITDMMTVTEACSRDDFFEFAGNNQFIHHRGVLRCFEDEPESSSTRWSLSRNNELTYLSISGTPYYEVILRGITADSMHWEVPFLSLGNGQFRRAYMSLIKAN
jgi:hypothetical protein